MIQYNELDNPYTLQFSYIPPQFIERTLLTQEVINNFIRKVPTYRGIFLTGIRGCGKTAMMGNIRNRINTMEDWLALDLNPDTNLIEALARGMYLIPEIRNLFIKAKIDFSVMGIGLQLENAELIATNEDDALKLMLETLKKAEKKLFVTIDEVTYNKNVAKFSHALSSYSNMDYDIYVLMTGLTENINKIKNDESLTFLYRAKVMELEPLNITSIRTDYSNTLQVDNEIAEILAYETRGYSLAFQAVGYYAWNILAKKGELDKGAIDEIRSSLDSSLSELAYEKIWSELSIKDKEVLKAMAELCIEENISIVKVEKIRDKISMKSDSFTKYRERLTKSGILDGTQYGYLRFKLPRFEEFAMHVR